MPAVFFRRVLQKIVIGFYRLIKTFRFFASNTLVEVGFKILWINFRRAIAVLKNESPAEFVELPVRLTEQAGGQR